MVEDPEYVEVEDYDESEIEGFNSKPRGTAALHIVDENNSEDDIKRKMRQNTISEDLNIKRENTPIEGFRNIQDNDDGLFAEVVFIQDLDKKKILGEGFKVQRVHFPPDNIAQLKVVEYDAATIVYLFTGSDKKANRIQSYFEQFFSTVQRLNPTINTMVDSIFENKSQVYELEVDPEIAERVDEEDVDEVEIEGNTVSGSKGLLVLDDKPLIKNLGLDRANPPKVEKVKTREWVDGNDDTSVELTFKGQVKAHFPLNHFDDYSEKALFKVLIGKFEEKITDRVLES